MVVTSWYRGAFKRGSKLELVGRVIWSGRSWETPWLQGGKYLALAGQIRNLTQVNRRFRTTHQQPEGRTKP